MKKMKKIAAKSPTLKQHKSPNPTKNSLAGFGSHHKPNLMIKHKRK